MQAVIVAGGLGTRLGPISASLPKTLVPIDGIPFVDYLLDMLIGQGVDDIVLCVGHMGADIEQHVRHRPYDSMVRMQYDGPLPLDVIGAVRRATDLLADSFLVAYGDAYPRLDYRDAARTFAERSEPVMMTACQNTNPHHQNDVDIRGLRVHEFDKTHPNPRRAYLNFGVTFMRRSVLSEIPEGVPVSEQEFYSRLAREGRLGAYRVEAKPLEIGRPESLAEFAQLVQRGVIQRPSS